MRRKYPKFTANELSKLIDDYFKHIKGEYLKKRVPATGPKKYAYAKVCVREPEPATFSGLALFLGFTSSENFDAYLQKSRNANILSQGHLRVVAEYEKRLHDHYTSGPIFALRSKGWKDGKTIEQSVPHSLNINVIDSGPKPAGSEKEVIMENDLTAGNHDPAH